MISSGNRHVASAERAGALDSSLNVRYHPCNTIFATKNQGTTGPLRLPHVFSYLRRSYATKARSHDVARNADTGARSTERHLVYVALGSNLGERERAIAQALLMMAQKGIHVKRTSGLYETEPMYMTDQDRFLNGVCEVRNKLLSLRRDKC